MKPTIASYCFHTLRPLAVLAFALSLTMAQLPAEAQTDRYWSGQSGASDNLSDSGNWFSPGTPAAGDHLNFNNTAGSRHWIYNDGIGGNYYFGNFIQYSGAGYIRLYGEPMYLYKFENNNEANLLEAVTTIGSRTGPDADLEINPVGTGGVAVTNVVVQNGRQLKVFGSRTLTVNGAITQSGSGNASLAIIQGATVILKQTNTYAGNTLLTNGTLVVTNGGAIVSPQAMLLLSPGGAVATNTLHGGGSITVGAVIATNVQPGGVNNAVFNFLGGTLTTSNAANAVAANIAISSNATLVLNSTWNMLGGTNFTRPAVTNGSASQFTIGNSGTGAVLVANAVWDLSGNGYSNTVLNVGNSSTSARGTLVIASNGAVQNIGNASTSAGLRIGLGGGSQSSLIITNGGQLLGLTHDLVVGNGGSSVSNSLVVSGSNSVINSFSTANTRVSAIQLGVNSTSAYNSALVDAGLVTNIYQFNIGVGTGSRENSVTLTNGARVFINSGGAGSLVGSGNGAFRNSMLVYSNSMMQGGGKDLTVASGNNNYSNSLVVSGGVISNLNNFPIGSTGATNQNFNTVTIANGGRVYFGSGTGVGNSGVHGLSNLVTVTDAGSLLSSGNAFYVGRSIGGNLSSNASFNGLILSNGARMVCGTLAIGRIDNAGALSASNYAIVGGGSGDAILNGNVTVGFSSGASNNYFVLNSGGVLSNGTITVGAAGTGGSKCYFNGGRFIAGGNVTPLSTAADGVCYVQAGGAVFDDNGFALTQGMALTEDPASPGGSVTKLGSGSLTLTNLNTFGGGLYIKAGTLIAKNTSRMTLGGAGGNGLGMVFLGDNTGSANAKLAFSTGASWTNPIVVQANSGIPSIVGDGSSPNLYGALTNYNSNFQLNGGSGGVQFLLLNGTLVGSATVSILSGSPAAVVVFNGNGSDFTGTMVVSNSSLRFSSGSGPNSLPNAVVQVNPGATNQLNANATIGALSDLAGSGGTVVALTANRTLTISGTSSASFAGQLMDGSAVLSLTKAGSGVQTLAGANTYSGATTISGGTLALGAAGSINNSTNIVVSSGATYDVSAVGGGYHLTGGQMLGGTGTVKGPVTVDAGATITVGGLTGTPGTLTVNHALVLTGTTALRLNKGGVGDLISVSGGTGNSLTLGGTLNLTNLGAALAGGDTFALFQAGSFAGTVPAAGVLPALPVQTPPLNWYLGNLTNNGSVRINRAPTANAKTYSVTVGGAITIPVASGVKSLASDADGDSVTFTALGSTNGVDYGTAVITGGGTSLSYTNTSGSVGNADVFSYAVSDGCGGLATNTLSIYLTSATGANLISATAGDGNAYLTYGGISGTNYALDRASSLVPPINWVQQEVKTAPADGVLRFTNLLSTWPTNDFYRTRYVP